MILLRYIFKKTFSNYDFVKSSLNIGISYKCSKKFHTEQMQLFFKEIKKIYSKYALVAVSICPFLHQAIWMAEPRDVTEDMHEEFYRFISNAFDKPQYTLHYKTDAPLNLRALFYVPDYKPSQ